MATSAILSSALSLIHNAEGSSSCPCITTKQELNQLKETLLRIQPLIGDAEKKEIQETSVHQWLKELRLAAYDAEDALDAYHFHLLSQSKEDTEKVCNPPNLQYVSRINCVRERLNEIAIQSESLGLREGPLDPILEYSPNESLISEEMVVFGRDDSKKRVVEWLLLDHECELSVIPIVGSGGVGKSKLAQIAYNDPLVCEHFDDRIWICVSEDFSPMRLMGTIIASLTQTPVAYHESGHLQVKQLLERKRFLLVLDDVQNNDQSLWESFRDSLNVGLVGSAVLVTTRDESIARMIQTVPFYHLNCLSDEDSWSLMQHCVSASSRVPNPELTLIRKRITRKLGGLPLAIRMIGSGRLSSVNSEEILHKLHTDLCNLEPNERFDMFPPAIALSYYNLPGHLKRCFLYCALFPKLIMWKCDELTSLPGLPSLKSLELSNCNEKMCYSLSPALLERLQFLTIHSLGDLASFPLHKLSAIKELQISSCTATKFSSSSLGHKLFNLTSLKILKIHYCSGMCFSQDQQLPSTLQILDILHCPLIADWCRSYGSKKVGHIRIILDHKEFHPVD